MGSLSSLLNIARSALVSDQAALTITSDNVANQNTAGYTRQLVTWHGGDYVTLGNGSQIEATAPTVTASYARDPALEKSIQVQQQAVANTSSLSSLYSQIQSVFSITSSGANAGSTTLGTSLDSFFASFTALASDPQSTATRQGVLSAASTLASAFNAASTQLSTIASTATSQAVGTADQINALSQTIASLNGQIGSQSPNADAGALEDQRQTAIEQLSQYVGVHQISTERNGITLTTTGGAVLVAGANAYSVSVSTSAGALQVFDASGNAITSGIQGGTLGGLLQGVNTELPAISGALDQLAFSLGSQVNTQNAAGSTVNSITGSPVFHLPTTAAGAAAAISVLLTNPADIAASQSGLGTSDNTNANAFAALANTNNTGGQTFDTFFASLLSRIGTSASAITAKNTAQQASLTSLTTQRDSYSAVSLDEEAANLTQFQRSYEAQAKVFAITNTLFSDAINLGVETAVA